MTMTRKDYRVVASALRITRPDKDTAPGRYSQWEADRRLIANELRQNYSNFKRDVFIDWTDS